MRISREHAWMEVAEVAAMRSTCFRGNVGAIIVKNKEIVTWAYNGAPAGEEHCLGNECPTYPETGGCMKSVHAEKNAITKAIGKLKAFDLGGCELYCTYSPCVECATLINRNYIMAVYYRYSYRDPRGLNDLLSSSTNRKVHRITPSGFIIDQRTGRIVE